MSSLHDLTQKSRVERVLHALSFELIATLICAPVIALVMKKTLWDTGVLTLMFATIAMLWNMFFTWLFDRAQRRYGFSRTLQIRLLHATAFELGLIVVLVPLAAWWLGISLLEAFLLDIGMTLFFLPYALIFNWAYDMLKLKHLTRRAALQAQS